MVFLLVNSFHHPLPKVSVTFKTSTQKIDLLLSILRDPRAVELVQNCDSTSEGSLSRKNGINGFEPITC